MRTLALVAVVAVGVGLAGCDKHSGDTKSTADPNPNRTDGSKHQDQTGAGSKWDADGKR